MTGKREIEPIAGYWKVESVRQALRLFDQAMRDLLMDTQTPVFRHPGDRRRRLIRDDDAQKLMRPQPDRPRKNQRNAIAA